jgi:hypothetical protein
MKSPSIVHQLNIGDTLLIRVNAGDTYSANRLEVMEGEVYRVLCNKGQWWVDMVIPASPAGYYNPIANLFGQRVKGVKCLCLCGAYNGADERAFAIGLELEFSVVQTGILSFFANDVPGYEWNNWGSIAVNIERIK